MLQITIFFYVMGTCFRGNFCVNCLLSLTKDVDDFTNCTTHRSNLGVGWNRGSISRCRVRKEMSGHGKGRVKSIPKADMGIGKRVSQILLKMSGKFVQSGFGK